MRDKFLKKELDFSMVIKIYTDDILWEGKSMKKTWLYIFIPIQDKRMKCYTLPLAKISFFKKPIPALKIPQGSY